MENVAEIFDLLDQWRHLPDYQLERRADIFFALFLPNFLKEKFELPHAPDLIPEFPLRLGTLYPDRSSNQSCKVDYLAITKDRGRAFLIELKTDSTSRREKQDHYLEVARVAGLPAMLAGLLKIVEASVHKSKYCCLLRALEGLKLLELPLALNAAIESNEFSCVNSCLSEVALRQVNPQIEVLYVQPVAHRPNDVGFPELADWLEAQPNDIGTRFAQSLRIWNADAPGRPSYSRIPRALPPG